MYKYIDEAEIRQKDTKIKRFFILLSLLLALACVFIAVYGLVIAPKQSGKSAALKERIVYCVQQAQSSVNEISASVTSVTASQVGNIKGYVIAVDEMTVVYFGGQQNDRPDEVTNALSLLWDDIKEIDSVSRQSQKSTLDVRNRIQQHLGELSNAVAGI